MTKPITDEALRSIEGRARWYFSTENQLETVRALIARIRAAEAERDKLREALKAFVPSPEWWGWQDGEGADLSDAQQVGVIFTLGQVRAARAFMEEGNERL